MVMLKHSIDCFNSACCVVALDFLLYVTDTFLESFLVYFLHVKVCIWLSVRLLFCVLCGDCWPIVKYSLNQMYSIQLSAFDIIGCTGWAIIRTSSL